MNHIVKKRILFYLILLFSINIHGSFGSSAKNFFFWWTPFVPRPSHLPNTAEIFSFSKSTSCTASPTQQVVTLLAVSTVCVAGAYKIKPSLTRKCITYITFCTLFGASLWTLAYAGKVQFGIDRNIFKLS